MKYGKGQYKRMWNTMMRVFADRDGGNEFLHRDEVLAIMANIQADTMIGAGEAKMAESSQPVNEGAGRVPR